MPYIEVRTHVWLPEGMTRAPMLNGTIYESEAQWEQVRESVAQMEGYVCQGVGREELHEVEDGLFRRLQQLGRVLLERFVAESGTGYTPDQPPCTLEGEPLTYKGIETVSYLSIFGSIRSNRSRTSVVFWPVSSNLIQGKSRTVCVKPDRHYYRN